jgi:hypothetical protein
MYDDINLPESVMRPGHNRVALTIHAFDPDKGQLDNYLRYKNGGMHSAAEKVRKAGRRDDTILLHVNEEEFKQLRDQWGDPIINPDTGLPEYGFLKSLKKILKVVAPIALGFMVPGIGAAIAKAGFMGMSQATATALTGAALGGATGGKKGALTGLIGGFASVPGGSQYLGSKIPMLGNASAATQTMAGRAALGAASGYATGQDPLKTALGSAMIGSFADKAANSNFVQNRLANSPLLQQGALGALRGADVAGMTAGDPIKGAGVGALMGAGQAALEKFKNPAEASTGSPTPQQASGEPETNIWTGEQVPSATGPVTSNLTGSSGMAAASTSLLSQVAQYQTKAEAVAAAAQTFGANPDTRPVYDALTNFTMCDTAQNFGACLAQNWDKFNASVAQHAPRLGAPSAAPTAPTLAGIPTPQAAPPLKMATGGLAALQHLAVGGPGDGQDDEVPAVLEDGDFIITADVVSALGSGSTEGGFRALTQMVHDLTGGEIQPETGGEVNALLSNGEFRIPRAAVQAIGAGSINTGAKKLRQLMEGARKSYRSASHDKIPPKAKSPLAYMRTA